MPFPSQNLNVTWFCRKLKPIPDDYEITSFKNLITNPYNLHDIPTETEALGDNHPLSQGGCFGSGPGNFSL